MAHRSIAMFFVLAPESAQYVEKKGQSLNWEMKPVRGAA